ncbi:MAG: RagB/SusD family nutrient uptake outer membrane protein [Aestuariibaculum sp.]
MKKSIVIFILSIGLLNLSCDIERNPYEQIAVTDLFGSPEALQTATLGNYALLKGTTGYGGWIDQIHRLSEYPGDNVSLSGSTTDGLNYIYNYRAITNNNRVESFWRASYKAAVGCNVIIESALEGESDEMNQLIGENYYLRGLIYFQMGNVFGRPYNQGIGNLSVPLKLTSDINDIPNRSTVGEVYDQVIKDLKKAAWLMNEDKTAAFATKEAAQALLSRVYLYMENSDVAVKYADSVINSNRYQLLVTNDFKTMNRLNPKSNSEAIFNVTLNKSADLSGQNDDWYTIGSLYASIDGTGWGEMYASSTYLDLLEQNENDARHAFIQPKYVAAEEASRKPWVYWTYLDNNDGQYKYQTHLTTETAGVTTFSRNSITYTVQEETVNGKTIYYFMDGATKQYVKKGFEMEKRNGFPKWYIIKASLQEDDVHLWSPSVSRLAEMHLNKAESYAKQNMDQEALDEINIIRKRADIPEYDLSNLPTGKTILDLVLDERRLELAYEGHRKFDMFRNGRTIDRHYPGGHLWGSSPLYEIPATHNRVVEYLPEKQVLLQNLTQND